MKKCMYKGAALIMALTLGMGLTACGGASSNSKQTVDVQSVAMIAELDLAGVNRYTGVAEAKATLKIQKDSNKEVEACYVEVGQEVHVGDRLFSYDSESVQLALDTAKLQVEQMENSITSYANQIKQLEKDKASAPSSEKLSYTLQIQATELDKAEAEYNLKQKQAELAKLEKSAQNTDVLSTIDGVIQSINDGENQDYGYGYGENNGADAYITIMQTGTYKIKGTVSENNVYELYEGMPVMVLSRTDATKFWNGQISMIDTENTASNNNNNYYYDGGGENAAKYNFYVEMDDTEGMMMGQHVYILPGVDAMAMSEGIMIPAAFVLEEGDDYYVWAASKKDTLEKRKVTVETYDEAMNQYLIVDGLTMEDYLASPASGLSAGMQVVKYDPESYGFGGDDGEYVEGEFVEGEYEEGEFIEGEYEEGEVIEDGEMMEEEIAEESAAESE